MADVDLYDYKLNYTGSDVEKLLGAAKESKDILDSMLRVQYGIASISINGANVESNKPIVFNAKFNNAPRIVVMPVASEKIKVSLSSISATGFNITISSKNNISSADIYWIAIEQ